MTLKEMLNKKIEECLNAKKENKYIIVEHHDIKAICKELKELNYRRINYKKISDFQEEETYIKGNKLITLSIMYNGGIIALSKCNTEELENYLKTIIKEAKENNKEKYLYIEDSILKIIFVLQKIGYNLISMKSEPYSDYKENSYFFMNIKEGNKDVLKLFDNGENCRRVEWL